MLSYATDTADLTVNIGNTTGHAGGQAEGDVITGFEILVGGSGNDSLTGDDASNSILGGGGNDTLSGRNGPDSLTGGAGDDVFVVLARSSRAITSATLEGNPAVAVTVIDGNTNLAFGNGVDIITDFKTADDGSNRLDVPGLGGSLTSLEGASLGGVLPAGVHVAYGDFTGGVFNVNQGSAFGPGASDALMLVSDGINPVSSSAGWIVMENLALALAGVDFI